jgi:hypothetical protein
MGKKLEKIEIEKEDIEDLNFKTQSKNILYNKPDIFDKQVGGEELDIIDGEFDDGGDLAVGEQDVVDMMDADNLYDSEPIEESDVEEELNLDEIEKIYQQEDIDSNIKNTTNLISNILEDTKILEKKEKYMCEFSVERDNNLENQLIEEAYTKKFVYNNYIYKDDTIKNIKNKITCSVMNNEKFGKENYILPSRMYLWSEYIIGGKVEKIMIGQRWLKKNELFNIDVEPLQISKYEHLDGQIKNLRDTLKRYAGKIRREDEDSNILYDYENYIVNDEIFMIDIYNELGDKYSGNNEKITNLSDTYFKIYFPKIKSEDIPGIIEYLSGDPKLENTRIKNSFDTIYNDLIVEKEITDLIETTKLDEFSEYTKVFESGNFITQSVIHVNLEIYDKLLEEENKDNMNKLNKNTGEFGSILLPKLDLFRIFNDFSTTERYPFVQYQMTDGQIIFKYYEDYMYEFSKTKDNVDMITKWFENSPYGISFKVKLQDEKFMAINVNDIGKIEYKTQWKEEDCANMDDIFNTYSYVKDLVLKINEILINHPRKISVRPPENWEFRFAFINCIQKFKLPDNKIIDHNDLSEFASFFFPYVALVIEPRKRVSLKSTEKEEEEKKSKYGSYLRYKRVSKFENAGRIEQRILSYIRNFDFEDDILIDEISKQFNITPEKAKEEIAKVRTQFPNAGKLKKTIKKLDTIPKFKPPGIGIDIQGKIPEKYKIRISGAREQKQLERIINFINVLIYLYAETYLLKKTDRLATKLKLSKLTNIAKRRSKVNEIVDYQKEVNAIKQMAQIDKKRLGFTPEEGQNQWTRSCQNSGNDKKRRPQQTIIKNISELIKKGYVLNKKTGEYEKRVIFKKKGKHQGEIILKAIKVVDQDEQGNSNEIYYTCDPEDNGEHMFVGFLTRSNNPFGECMPCCFKKNRLMSNKKETIDFYKRCSGELTEKEEVKPITATGDILYILQDTNKIQENRISYLPKFIDWFANTQFEKRREIKNHYLLKTSGYYFKYGINQDNYSFFNTLESILGIKTQEIKNIIAEFFRLDTSQMYYYSLNGGDIRAEYQINDFINFVLSSENLDYYYLKDIIKIPGLFTPNGIFPIVFNKITQIIKRGNEREKVKDDFYFDIDKSMIDDFDYCVRQISSMDVLFMMKENKFYYPIVEIIKEEEYSKNIKMRKLYNKTNSSDKLIDELIKYFEKTVSDIQIDYITTQKSAKTTYIILESLAKTNKNYKVESQVIDSRFKCKYLITANGTVVPVLPSGIVVGVNPVCFNNSNNESMRVDCFSKLKLHNLELSNQNLEKLYELTDKKLNVKPVGVFYDSAEEKDMVNIIGIITSNNDLVPIEPLLMSKKELDKSKVQYQNRPLYHELDQKLLTYNKDTFQVIDSRIKSVNMDKYKGEAYQLFKFELSNLINTKEYLHYKKELKELIKKSDTEKIQDLILNICVNKLDNKIISKKTVGPELIKIIDDIPNIDYYKINNQRKICENLKENVCSSNPHCVVHNGKCKFALTQEYLFDFIKRLSIEIVEQEITGLEILRENKYFVSDIVDFNNFTEKPGQKIIKSTNTNLAKILTDMFGKEHVPKIGKRHIGKKTEIDLIVLKAENPLKDIKDAYQQAIIPYNYSILRSYCNGYYWIKHSVYSVENRNLGFYSELQNELINIFRSLIIDWLNISSNVEELEKLDMETKNILKNKLLFVDNHDNKRILINTYIIDLMENIKESNLGLLELFILNQIHNIPICYMINGVPKYYINEKLITIKKDDTKYQNSESICINVEIHSGINYPYAVDVIYYK